MNAVRGGWPHDPGLCRDRLRWADAQARRPSRRRLRVGRRGGWRRGWDRRPMRLQKVGITLGTCWTLGSRKPGRLAEQAGRAPAGAQKTSVKVKIERCFCPTAASRWGARPWAHVKLCA